MSLASFNREGERTYGAESRGYRNVGLLKSLLFSYQHMIIEPAIKPIFQELLQKHRLQVFAT
jgi:hypothetical protein